jgi:hypothetical protein
MAPELRSTYRGVALVGWMERDYAVRFLTEECAFDPPLSEVAATTLWQEYRDRATALPARHAPAPTPMPLTAPEREHAQRFLQFLGTIGVPHLDVIKVDPMQLVVAQYHIATDLTENYGLRCSTEASWMEETLPTSSKNPDVNVKFTRRNLDTEIEIDLPHAEFIFGVHPQGGFGPKELLGHVTVVNVGSRMLLGKGYHRLYARMSSTRGTASNRSALVALDPNTRVSPSREGTGAAGTREAPALDIFGSRPALFADFFTDGLFMKVSLRKKRYQLQVLAKWVALNEEA